MIPFSVWEGGEWLLGVLSERHTTIMNTATLAPVTTTAELNLGDERTATPTTLTVGRITAIVSRTDPSKTLGRRVQFNAETLSEYKSRLNADKSLNAQQRKAERQKFLNATEIEQRELLGLAAVKAAMRPDEFAPMGRVPDVMELRKNGGVLKFVSVETFIGKDKTETPAQKIARLENELRAERAALAEAKAERGAHEADVTDLDSKLAKGLISEEEYKAAQSE